MNLKVEIRREADGVIATDVWEEWDYSMFRWDRIGSCDCNRELFFSRAAKKKADAITREYDCGSERFSVRLSNADTGEVLYDEFQTRNATT